MYCDIFSVNLFVGWVDVRLIEDLKVGDPGLYTLYTEK
jgi:hypothetical protein